jgi:C-terminal of NADH-ubiquinone oxidoreductase 21 kDa subunit
VLFRQASYFLTFITLDRFYGFTENAREVEKDMRELTDKVKKGEPLYGKSQLSEYMQGVAARNSRYTGLFAHVIPWFNIVNHEHVSLYAIQGFIALF